MLYTIIQIVAFQALFLLVYDLFLRRETFFNYNRAYLLVTSVLSIVLPFIKFSELKTMATKDIVIHLPEVFIGTKVPTANEIFIAEQAGIIIEQPQTPLWQSIALIGVVLTALIFIYKIGKLYWLKFQNPKRWKGNVLIVSLIKSSAAFSFFNTIFLGERISETERPIIYKHELIHIKEYHSLDLLFFEALRIIFWFSPLVYIYQNRIKELHEYIADAKAVKQNGKADYYQSLLNQIFDVNTVSFTNTFFKKTLIKKRIAMLQKSKSKQLHLIKYLLLLPIVFGMLIYTSTEVRAQEKDEIATEISQEHTDAELIKKYYDELVAMKKDGASILEIANYAEFGTKNSEKYLLSKEEFLKSKAFMQYVADDMIARKSENGTLTQQDIQTAENMTLDKHGTYLDYRAWKKTDEAKEHWESYARDGALRLFVKEIGNQSAEEKKLLDGLLKQLESDDKLEKIILTDGQSMFVIDSYQSTKSEKTVEEIIEVPFAVIDESPTLVECKDAGANKERKNCLSQFINKHVNKNFNIKLADSLNPGKKRIFVQFKIDREGKVKDIKARGPSIELEQEAKRVLKTLPQFIPGRQKGKLVTVPYSLPIVFHVKGDLDETESSINESIVAERAKGYKESLRHMQKDSTKLDKIPYSIVETAPVHPDCVSISEDEIRRKCTSNAVNKMVNKNFNTDLANTLGLEGVNRIFVSFHISKQGDVDHIKVRAKHPNLEEEAKRVITLLPKFIPGRHDGEAVDVPYSLPIVFQIAGSKKN
jgi:beta-lactamase regulating signal transducer with metallopeptidase domain